MVSKEEDYVNACRLVAIRKRLEQLFNERLTQCETTDDIRDARNRAVQSIRAVVDPEWSPDDH